MPHQVTGPRSAPPRPVPLDPGVRAYLRDYSALLDAVPFPSFVYDSGFDVFLANRAYHELFANVGPHPTAMPHHNFLRFALFHPGAGSVLVDHESAWGLPLMALFGRALEREPEHNGLRAIRREIAADPIMNAAYEDGLPHWLRTVGECAVLQDGAVLPLLHPDPRWGRTSCRVVRDTPETLSGMGCARMTLVLRESVTRPPAPPAVRRARQPRRTGLHLRAVPVADA